MKATYKNKIKLRSSKEIEFIKKFNLESSYGVGLLILIKHEFYILFR